MDVLPLLTVMLELFHLEGKSPRLHYAVEPGKPVLK